MATHTHPVDRLTDELVGLYSTNARRLEGIVLDGLRRGLDPDRLGSLEQRTGDATLAYRRRQLEQARGILDGLDQQARQAAPLIVGRAYGSGVVTIDKITSNLGLARAGVVGEFGRGHVRAVEALASNMDTALQRAAERTRQNLELVFARADTLAGALPASGRVAGLPFLGRRVNDPYRRLALDELAGGIIGLDTRRQISASLARRLVTEGVTDALTGFVDAGGRRWSLESYAEMVARTTTREATTAATANRMQEHGLDLVTISEHVHPADECSPFEGNTYSLTGADPHIEQLPARPPFHPRCVHVMYPAATNLDDYERELERAAGIRPPPAPPTGAPAPTTPTTPTPAVVRAPRQVQAPDVPAPARASVEDGLTAVLGEHDIDLDFVEIAPLAKRAHRAQGGRFPDGRLGIRIRPNVGSSTGAARKRAASDRAIFKKRRDAEIAKLEKLLADDARQAPNVTPRLDALRQTHRYTVEHDAPDPLRAIVAHEAAHVIEAHYGKDRVRTLWRRLTANVPRSDRLNVSEYAATNDSELLAETIAALDADLPVPGSLREAHSRLMLELNPPRTPPPPPSPRVAPTPSSVAAPDRPPFGDAARPSRDDDSEERHRLQRLIAEDPGAEAGKFDALVEDAAKADARVKRKRRAALLDLMAPELAKELGFKRGTRPKKWAVDDNVVERLENGTLTIDEAETLAVQHYDEVELRRVAREIDADARMGSANRPIPCFICGKFKALPADVCEHCGDDPLSLGESAGAFNKAFGYFGPDAQTRKGLHYGSSGYGNVRERTGHWAG